MMNRLILLFALLSVMPLSAATFEDGDTVAFIGNTVIERAQNYGYLETTLTLAAGKKDLKFRNLGWSGDTVFGDARSYLGPPQEGFDRLKADLAEMKPSVVILCYGAVADRPRRCEVDHHQQHLDDASRTHRQLARR